MPTTLDAPETVVCRGALRAVTLDPLRTGGLAAQSRPIGPHPVGPHPGSRPPAPQTGPPTMAPPGSQPGSGIPQPVYHQPGPPTLTSPTRPTRRGRGRLLGVIGAVVVVAAAVAGVLVFVHPGSSAAPTPTPTSTPPQSGRLVAQYDYSFTAPPGWSQSGGDASQLKVQIAPGGSASAAQSIYVQEFRLTYDSTTNRLLAVGQLQQLVTNNGYQDFNSNFGYAGKTVVYYRESAGSLTVDWYVLFQGAVQVSVGCQYPNGAAAAIDAACRQVVSGMIITN